jgi:glyoxylase-like metal-dependent hydrolase (beta-lactamase superfamily II)
VNVTFGAAPGISGIDTKMLGREMVTSAYLLHGDEPTLVETGPSLSRDAVGEGLAELGIGRDDLAHVVVTHIHLDHAGGVGTLARSFPRATIWVHHRGAPHLVDPTKLVSSVERVYGAERAHAYFGGVEPAPAERIRSVDDGDVIRLGARSLEVLYTPGHASHHVALVDSETGAVFAGDAIGVHLPDVKVLRPATPPPDIDVELAVQSIERIRDRTRSVLLLSHYGTVPEFQAMCDLAILRIRGWAEDVREALGRTDDVDEIVKVLQERVTAEDLADAGEGADMEKYEMLSSVQVNAMGLIRYWRKRWEREAAESASGT